MRVELRDGAVNTNNGASIAMFTSWLTPSKGGIENLSFGMFTHLREISSATAFSLNIDDSEKIENVFYSKTEKRTIPFFEFLSAFWRKNKQQKFTFCIAMHIMLGIVTLFLKKTHGIPYAVYLHGKEIFWIQTPLHKMLYKMILSNADFVMANSKFTKSAAENITKTDVMILHPAIDAEAFTHDITVNPPCDHIKLLSIGRLERRKGTDSVIRAVKMMKDLGHCVEYNIVGIGEFEKSLRAIVAECNLEECVIFHGHVSQEKKYNFIKHCDLFLMPSYAIPEEREVEGFGIVYIEANALGKFVIGGKSGGISDAVVDGETGYIVDGLSPDEIFNAITKYLALPQEEKEQLAKKSRTWAISHNWESRAKELMEKIQGEIRV